MKLKFFGAAGTVTGSRTLLTHRGYNILIDCGLFQGPKALRQRNWNPFMESFSQIDAVILTHAHLDHTGYIPLLVKNGFKGKIYCTVGTRELTRIILLDSAHLQEEDALYANRSGYSHHRPALPLYTIKDAENSFPHFQAVDRDKWINLDSQIQFRFLRSGHLLGSSFIQLACNNDNSPLIITFSGDLGNGRSYIVKPPVKLSHTDVLVLESTYGNREYNHTDPLSELESIVNRVIGRNGTLLIPAFSVGRAQEVLYLLHHLKKNNKIPSVPVFLDSPMANHVTDIYAQYTEDLQFVLDKDQLVSPICLSGFTPVKSVEDSKVLNYNKKSKIIISASGMLTGGRVMHHLKTILPDSQNGILFVGFQASETKGRVLLNGVETLRVHHQEIPVRCEVVMIDSLSAHAWASDTMKWIEGLRGSQTKIFLNHGESDARQILAERIRQELGLQVVVPESGDEFKFFD